VVEGNARSWILRPTVNGRRPELGLGGFPEVSLADARDKAWGLLRARNAIVLSQAHGLSNGVMAPPAPLISPAAAAVLLRAPTTVSKKFKDCAATYIEAQEPGWKSPKHAAQWRSTLETYAYPEIGQADVSRIETSHVVNVLKPIWHTKTETATRVRGRIEAVLDWCKHKGYRQGENPARWDGNLEHELPSPAKLKKRKQRHHPALPYTRMGAFMLDLRERKGISARALEWGILNASRYQEIAGAKRKEIDLQLKRWTVPKERMKREIEHVVPLSDDAIALFNGLPPGDPDGLLFPAPEGGQLSDSALGAMIDAIHDADLARGGEGYVDPKEERIATQHGFRSTFRDWAAEIEFFDRDIAEHAIAHKLKDKAEAAYQRGELLMKRAFIMQRWAQFCRAPEFNAPDLTAQMRRAA
jgi:integrase